MAVTIFESKNVYGKMNKAFNKENLINYLKDVLDNKAKFTKLPPLPKFNTIK